VASAVRKLSSARSLVVMNCLQLDPSPVLKLPGRESQETIANLVRPRVLSPARTYRHCQSNRSHRKGREQTLNYSRDSKWKVTWWQRYECHWPLSERTSITAGTSRQLVTVGGFIIHPRTARPRSSITDRRSRGRHSIPIFPLDQSRRNESVRDEFHECDRVIRSNSDSHWGFQPLDFFKLAECPSWTKRTARL